MKIQILYNSLEVESSVVRGREGSSSRSLKSSGSLFSQFYKFCSILSYVSKFCCLRTRRKFFTKSEEFWKSVQSVLLFEDEKEVLHEV